MEDKSKFKLNIPSGGLQFRKPIIPVLGKVLHSQGRYWVNEPAIVGKQYKIICPACGKEILIAPQNPIALKVICEKCNTAVLYNAIKENTVGKDAEGNTSQTDTIKQPLVGSKSNAKFVWSSFKISHEYVLKIGKNYVGREDKDNPSDLSFKDKYASAKSFCIEVNKDIRGYSFLMTVENATNPVLINKKEQPVGSRFNLNYGDIIEFGYPPNPICLTLKPVKK